MSVSSILGLVYFASELLLTITRRSHSKTGTKQDKSTLGMIWVVIGLSIAAGIFVALIGVVVPSLGWLYSYAWFVGFAVSGAAYILLMKGSK